MILCDNLKIASKIDAKYVKSKELPIYDGNLNVSVIIGSRAFIRASQSFNLPQLKYVQVLSAGIDGIDIGKFTDAGIVFCNAAGIYSVGMAEFVLYSVLMSAKRFNRYITDTSIRLTRGYKYLSELAGKTIGIMGVGNIGTEIAKRARAFDMNVIGYAEHTTNKEPFLQIFHNENIALFASRCDYIVCTLPDTEKTFGLINSDFLNATKSNLTFINVGRKSVINDSDMLAHFKKYKDKTAILDMFEKFPNPITNPYRRMKNVKVLPGVTAISQEIDEKLLDLIWENLKRFESKECLLNVLNK